MRAPCVISLLVAIAFGCSSEDRNPYLDTTGGGSGNASGGVDASPEENLPRTALLGSICEIVDLRSPTACVANPANIAIATSLDEASSDAMGDFAIDIAGTPSSVVLTVSDSAASYRSSIVRVVLPSEGAWPEPTLPIIDDELMLGYEELLGEGPSDNTAILIVYVQRDGAPLAGAVLQSAPGGTLGGSYYDAESSPFLDIGAATGSSGVIAIFGVPASGAAQISVLPALGEDPVNIQMPTVEGGITFHTADLPAPL